MEYNVYAKKDRQSPLLISYRMEVEKMLETVMTMLAKQLRIDVNTLEPDTNIIEDLSADSLDIVEMLMTIEQKFGITVSDEEAMTLKTIKDVADFIEKKI